MIYWFSCVLLRLGLRLFGGVTYIGLENLPKKGGFILAPNHISLLDPPAAGCGFRRQVHFMAKKELFRTPIRNWWMRAVGTFPVNRGSADRGAIRTAIDFLDKGDVFCLFPEGTRSSDGKLGKPELGVGMIALKSKAPVVPALVVGTDKALPNHGRPHRHPMKVIYGKPISFPEFYGEKDTRESIEEVGRRVMAAIAELKNEWE